MKKLVLTLFTLMATLLVTAGTAQAVSPSYTGDSPNDFVATYAVETPGTYPPVVTLYGSTTRFDGSVKYGQAVSSNLFTTAPVVTEITGIDYTGAGVPAAFLPCPAGKSCGGAAAFYILDVPKLVRCTSFSGGMVNGCDQAYMTTVGLTSINTSGISISTDGNTLYVPGKKAGDTKHQIYAINLTTNIATKLSACSDASNNTFPAGGVAGNYMYVIHQNKLRRFLWTGSDCTGPRLEVNAAAGWDDDPNTVATYTAAIGNLTGTAYYSHIDGMLKVVQKDASCSDYFISQSEKCDPLATPSLNNQTCTSGSVPGGFTGGSLACNGSCGWDTSSCTSPATCGNGTKEGAEVCDGSDFGSATCASIKGAGWTGSLVCTGSCSTIDSSSCSPPPPVCGNGSKEGSEVCDGSDHGSATCVTLYGAGWTGTPACKGDCTGFNVGTCSAPASCGDGVKNGAESCDGSDLGSASCASVMGAGWTGSLACKGDCSFNTSACTPPPSCGDGIKNGTDQCDASDFGSATCSSVKGAGWTGSLSCTVGCTINSSACIAPPICGDGVKNGSDQCDGVDLGGASCSSILGGGYGGTLSCNAGCTYNTSACTPPVTCGNGMLDAGEQCDGTNMGGKSCSSTMGTGWTGELSCSGCVLVTSGCTPPPWGLKVTSGDCKVNGEDQMNPTFVTASGVCKVSLLPKNGVKETQFEVTADGVHNIPVKVGIFPAIATQYTVTYGVKWVEVESYDNHASFGFGAGIYAGDIGTGFSFDALTAYPVVTFNLDHGNWCFSLTDPTLTDKWGAVKDTGNGVGCLSPGYSIDINVETKTIVKGPYTKGTGVGGAGGDGGAGGSDGGSGGSDAGAGGNPGTDDGGGDGGGCSCVVPGKDGSSSWPALMLLSVFVALSRIKRRR
ncbi:MAG: hypothetical protein LC118_18005 [Dehalococcoidia bacterium]|nr:hypothetical protein [Dehalococcoidia bacterium]